MGNHLRLGEFGHPAICERLFPYPIDEGEHLTVFLPKDIHGQAGKIVV